MRQPPPWWSGLTADPITRSMGIAWRDPSDWEPAENDDLKTSDGVLQTEGSAALHARDRAGKLLVGTGPGVIRRLMGSPADVCWYLDPARPEFLWCALDEHYAAWLWIPVAPTPAGLREAIGASHPRPTLTRTDLTAFTRGFAGFKGQVELPNVYTGEPVEFNGHDLDRYMTMVHYTEVDSWASHHLDDPLADDLEPTSPLAVLSFKRQNRTGAQRIGRVPSMTWRTAHSRSYLSFEVFERDIICASVRYRPSPASHRRVVERANTELATEYPVDLPLDVVGALNGFPFMREDGLLGNLTAPERPEHLYAAIRIFAALWSGDLRRTRRLREFAAHSDPETRRVLAQTAMWYGYRFLLEEIALAETDPELIAALEHFQITLDSQPGDDYNAFGDYFDGSPVMVDRDGDPVPVSDDEAEEHAR